MTLFGDDPDVTTSASAPPKWSAVNAGRCDACVVIAVGDPAHRIASARWRRTADDGDRRYCYPHAQPVRQHDERQ